MSQDYKDLIARLRAPSIMESRADWIDRMRTAADAIAALVAERDATVAVLRMVRTIIDEADKGYSGNEFTYPYKQWTAAVRDVLTELEPKP